VLLIDDQEEITGIFADMLRDVGKLEVYTADSGVSGLEVYYQVHPHCVVVDVRMPEIDGYQFVRVLRGDPETAQTPIIILSALIQPNEVFAGMITGADSYLTKPVTPSELIAAIRAALAMGVEERLQRLRRLSEDDSEQ
jgi:DNA-binding response OmpR family regulator